MALSERENYLLTASMAGPEWIPCTIGFSGATWTDLREELEEVLVRHPILFPHFQKGKHNYDQWDYGPAYRPGELYTDAWGCVWENIRGGLEGQVKVHPLDDYAALETYQPPDPLTQAERGPRGDWNEIRRQVEVQRARGELTTGGGDRFFERLHFLRGFENLMVDFITEPPELQSLIDMVIDHNMQVVTQWLSLEVDVMRFGDDLGTQTAAMVSPKVFHKWLSPGYKRMMHPCRAAGCQVALHSDGYIMDLMDELIECGVTIINPQDLCNGIDNLARYVKGRICIDLDIDRQKIIPFGTRREIRELIKEEVTKLGSPQGGLMFTAGIYPPTPPENIDALCCALEEFRTYWWQ